MGWRIAVVKGSAKIDFKMNYIVVTKISEQQRIHIEEIDSLIIETTDISITAYAMCELVKNKVNVVFCDKERNPYYCLAPLNDRFDANAKVHEQLGWSDISKKSIWTEIVKRKIFMQRELLVKYGQGQEKLLKEFLEQVEFNDRTNREAHAARVYFNALFGTDFNRDDDKRRENVALNYGYSILLSSVNREIAAAGYLTQLGIFHDNIFNRYNFGSDIMEPLRPIVDSTAIRMELSKFDKDEKLKFVNLLNSEVICDGKKYYLSYAIRIYCNSIFKALSSGNADDIKWITYEL